ncbi:STM4014 family protein (plasmid) [Deinococcus taeanensis]|uniref:STM4014 family protein n=1 Tax=Deinococcus taeanensis TaxID=2737050 RepID=UPI001CDB85A4|nr:STM4014 family protein [Deinococcus taeanensis]UBV45239.1 STM4014 family protein [Deinococcus taeanensis]
MTPEILLIAPPAGRRAQAFAASLAGRGLPPPQVVSYLDVLRGHVHLCEQVRPGTVVRLDSPGEDIATEEALIGLGGGTPGDLTAGELAPMQAWYAGFARFLQQVDAQLAQAAPHVRMQRSDHILTMFDKAATHARLLAAGVPVPEALPRVESAEALFEQAAGRGWSRVFVKLAHGSSASGAVALQWKGTRVSAVTTVRMVDGRLYNSRRLVRYDAWSEVHALLNALAPHRLHVERWLPKASFEGRTIDLRVVVIGGRAQHTLVRAARGPITNLHLGNERGDVAALRAAAGPERWAEVMGVARSALAAFPGALYGGVDVLLTPGLRRAAVLEVNAFGDYHRGVHVDGLDTYGAQLRAVLEPAPC